MVQVVIGVQPRARRVEDTEYLVGRRSGKAYTGCWEFPGGKVEADETPPEALVREWLEELGQDITVEALFFDGRFTTTDLTDFQALAYRVSASSYEVAQIPKLAAHDDVVWMTRAEILALPDDRCTPSLKPIARVLPMSEHERLHRAEKCVEVAQARACGRRLSAIAIENEALALMPEGKLEAALLAIPE